MRLELVIKIGTIKTTTSAFVSKGSNKRKSINGGRTRSRMLLKRPTNLVLKESNQVTLDVFETSSCSEDEYSEAQCAYNSLYGGSNNNNNVHIGRRVNECRKRGNPAMKDQHGRARC